VEVAAIYAGVSATTVAEWVRRGEMNPQSRYGTFGTRIRDAQARAEMRALLQWQKAAEKNWLANVAFLERRFPERWSRFRDMPRAGVPQVNVQVNQSMGVQQGFSQGMTSSSEARAALLEMVAQLTPDQERELLADYDRLREAAGAMALPERVGVVDVPGKRVKQRKTG
jgi:hypothetical protein